MKNTFHNFLTLYPDNDACLDKLCQIKSKQLQACPSCGVVNPKFIRVKGRRSYRCSECAYQFYPTAGTVFEKTTTPLTYWFYAIYQMSVTRNGVSAKELERALGVTYKTAWRMANHIRRLMSYASQEQLNGIIEVDETYVGGKDGNRHEHKKIGNRGLEGKIPVLAILERKGTVMTKVVDKALKEVIEPIVIKNIETGANVMTDEWYAYNELDAIFDHNTVSHKQKEYVRGLAHTNSVEGFFSQVKRTLYGTYIHVSPKYLQHYVDECAFRYSNNKRPDEMFELILARA